MKSSSPGKAKDRTKESVLLACLQQVLNLLLKLREICEAGVPGVNAAIAADNKGGGKPENASVLLRDLLVADDYRVIDFVFAIEVAESARLVFHGDPDGLQTVTAKIFLQ